MSKGSEKDKDKEGLGTTLVLGAAIAAGGLGVYLATRKPETPVVRVGDTVTVYSLTFKYRGVETDLYLCWGLKKRPVDYWSVDFNNGEALVGGLWVWGGPIHALESPDWEAYKLNPQKELRTKPALFIDPVIVEPAKYQTYVWMTKDEPFVDRDNEFLRITIGPWIDVRASQ